MLHYTIVFFVLAVCAGFLGFGGLAAEFAYIARFLAGLFVVLFLASLVYSLLTGRKANLPTL
ncbi:MAG: DUF1328 domain-containing protein [Alphaproteobacteria bacterium]|nr:DUF1328 domain-containing protein [Alphaproteobacteria bacterium]